MIIMILSIMNIFILADAYFYHVLSWVNWLNVAALVCFLLHVVTCEDKK